jgi:hypothetical protein
MASITQPGSRFVSTVFGLLMVGSAAATSNGPTAVAGTVAGSTALIAVVAGLVLRGAATLAVLLSVLTIVLSYPSPVLTAFSGLCAAAYLVCRYADGTRAGAVLGSWPTIVAAVSFTSVGLFATSFPLQLPWLPMVSPLAVLAIYVLATRPFLG